VSRIVVLDSGPLGLVTNPRGSERSARCKAWLPGLLGAGVRVVVPAIADDEIRRELIRAGKATGVARLDALAKAVGYLPLRDDALKLAARPWVDIRNAGLPTAADPALDGDVILAAQARVAAEAEDLESSSPPTIRGTWHGLSRSSRGRESPHKRRAARRRGGAPSAGQRQTGPVARFRPDARGIGPDFQAGRCSVHRGGRPRQPGHPRRGALVAGSTPRRSAG
jgi:predicted nucleic acid-binding protein